MPPQIIHITLAIAFVSVWAIVGQIVIRSKVESLECKSLESRVQSPEPGKV